MKKICKKKLLMTLTGRKGIVFHLAGIACLLWFVIRVAPAPHRWQYPCQQVSRTVATGYIAYWSALLIGVSIVMRRTQAKIASFIPVALAMVLIGGTVMGSGISKDTQNVSWTAIANDPIGIPTGLNPGRVVWVWNPDATETTLDGYWWNSINNNQTVIDAMMSSGLQNLTGAGSDTASWDLLFRYFNALHGKNDTGYLPGEKIAIKINMNNCYAYVNPYTREDNDRDASPFVVKALLRQLVNVVGVSQDDIVIYDASRPIPNWFYHRVYYETYPSSQLTPEFPYVHFADAYGDAEGRELVVASDEKIYFSDGLVRTLPTCVAEADYFINMPLLKRHPISNGVTLSGKNLFGSWMEPVEDVHTYHQSGLVMGNPAPQVDLLAHRALGGKTLLYLGDGTYATAVDHRTIAKFNMYPFNNDWTNSLFFSQDPVAMDSVMYDFLYTEGTNPIEGSQNYLHQAAEPAPNTYDPEHDGIYLSASLGTHEHWDTTVDIFSPLRYSGPAHSGIEFVALGSEYVIPAFELVTPKSNRLYIAGRDIMPFPATLIIGDITVEATVNDVSDRIDYMEFYIDTTLQHTVYDAPYEWVWTDASFGTHHLKVAAFYDTGETSVRDLEVWKIL